MSAANDSDLNDGGGPSRSRGFVKLLRGDHAESLIRRFPHAFTLLAVIAMRARYAPGSSLDGIAQGQALLGDHVAYGMTEKAYRCAKRRLESLGLATFFGTRHGTIATLADGRVFSLAREGNSPKKGTQKGGHRGGQFPEAKSENGADSLAALGRTWGGLGATKKKGRREEREEGREIPALSFPWKTWEAIPAEDRDRLVRDSGKDESFCRSAFDEIRGRKLQYNDRQPTPDDWLAVLGAELTKAARRSSTYRKHVALTTADHEASEDRF